MPQTNKLQRLDQTNPRQSIVYGHMLRKDDPLISGVVKMEYLRKELGGEDPQPEMPEEQDCISVSKDFLLKILETLCNILSNGK